MYVIVLYKVVCEDINLFYHVGVEVDFDVRYFLLLVTDSLTEAEKKAQDKLDEYSSYDLEAKIEIRELSLEADGIV